MATTKLTQDKKALAAVQAQAENVKQARGTKRKGASAKVNASKVANSTNVKLNAKKALAVWADIQNTEGNLLDQQIKLGEYLSAIRSDCPSDQEYNAQIKANGLDVVDSSARSRCRYVFENLADIKKRQKAGDIPQTKSVEVLYKKHKALTKPAKAKAPAKGAEPKAKVKVTNETVAAGILKILKENPSLDWLAIAEIVDKG